MRLIHSLALAALIAGSLSAVGKAAATTIYAAVRTITPGSPVPTGGIAVSIACSGGGPLRLVLANGQTIDIFAQTGTAIVDGLEIVDVSSVGTTASCVVASLYPTPSHR